MIKPISASYRFMVVLAIVLLGACSRGSDNKGGDEKLPSITGTISFSSPVTFDEATRLEMQVTDVSISDGQALTVASMAIDNLHQLPYQYSLSYSPEKIDSTHRYTIEARIYAGQTLRFATDTAYAVLTQGSAAQRNLSVVAAGSNTSSAPPAINGAVTDNQDQFAGELRTRNEVSLYRAGLKEGHIHWLDEERSNNSPEPLQAHYEFKGALLLNYRESSVEIKFDERGRPQSMRRGQKSVSLKDETTFINVVRNRAELLRSHALATRESLSHRQATEQWQGMSGLTQFK